MAIERCPFSNEACKYWGQKPPKKLKGQEFGCFSDEHHLYWPSPDYTSKSERSFRQLPENKVQLCRMLHDEMHHETPPEKTTPREDILLQLGQLTTELFGVEENGERGIQRVGNSTC